MSSKNMKRVFMLLLAAAAMMAFPSVSHMFGMGKPAEKITSFEIVTLRLSGMRFTTEYEIVMKDKEAEVVEYAIRYEKNEDKRIPQRQMLCSADRILKLLNDCELTAWDGFHGKHPSGVKDGIMFSLQATVNNGRKIKAEGSENFPKHFREFRDGLHAMLSQKK